MKALRNLPSISSETTEVFEFGEFSLNLATRTLTKSGQEIPLTFKRVVEEGAVYHLAQFTIDSHDTLTFSITVKAGKDAPQSFEFLQEIFPDE